MATPPDANVSRTPAGRSTSVTSLSVVGGIALGLGGGVVAHAAPANVPEPPLQLRLSRSLSLHAPTSLPPVAVLSDAALGSGNPLAPPPFKLRWADAVTVAQVSPLESADPEDGPSGVPAPLPGNEGRQFDRTSLPPPEPPGSRKDSGSKYGLAPIRWGGEFGYSYSKRRSDDSDDSQNHIYQIVNRASSYILYPWLAKVDGNLSVALIKAKSSSQDNSTTGNVSLTGGLGLDLFPVSRFPFRADFSVSDTRTSGALTSADYRTYRLMLRQNYRPPQGRWTANGAFNMSMLEGNFGRDTVYQLTGGYDWRGDEQGMNIQSTFSTNSVTDGATNRNFVTVANHYMRVDEATRVDSGATLAIVEVGGLNGAASDSSTNIFQLYSVGSWTPIESKWRASASARLSRTGNQAGDTDISSTTAAVQAGVNYRATNNLNLSGTAALTGSPDRGASSLTSTVSAGAVYAGDPLRFGNYSYNWSVAGNLSSSSSEQFKSQTANLSANHSLGRSWMLGERSSLSASLAQTATTFRSTGEGGVGGTSLGHTASLSLSASPTDETVGFMGLSVSDSRTYGDFPSTYQSANLQIGGDWRLSPRASISGNMTWQKALQKSERQVDPFTGLPVLIQNDDATLNGAISYIHTRAFSIRGLVYSLQLSATSAQGNQRQFGDPDATREGTSRNVDSRLSYRIGRLDTQLQLRFAEVDGKKNALLFFRVSRSFGAY